MREIWGILGGMGPLASAEFLRTIYEQSYGSCEQELPTVILISDPTIPDRTSSFRNGLDDLLLEHFQSRVGQLVGLGVTRIVTCCMTIHPLIARLPLEWQMKMVSLTDLVFDGVMGSSSRYLMLCTDGTRRQRLFETHRRWQAAKDKIIMPDESDQTLIHRLIYEIKSNRQHTEQILLLGQLLDKYKVDSYIAGCTEIHVLAKQHLRASVRTKVCVDPLMLVAAMITGMAETPDNARPAVLAQVCPDLSGDSSSKETIIQTEV